MEVRIEATNNARGILISAITEIAIEKSLFYQLSLSVSCLGFGYRDV